MGVGHFKVEVEDLGRLLKALHDSQDNMRKALNALKDVGPKSTGSEALDNACDEFHDSWDDAIKKIADGTQAIEERLKQTKNNYEQTEQVTARCSSRTASLRSLPLRRLPSDPGAQHTEPHRTAHVCGPDVPDRGHRELPQGPGDPAGPALRGHRGGTLTLRVDSSDRIRDSSHEQGIRRHGTKQVLPR